MRFVCIDTETTGLNPKNGARIIEISAVEIIDNMINKDRVFQNLINPNVYIPRYITRINGITNPMIRNALPSEVVLKAFKEFIGDSLLIFQNAGFDLTFLNYELQLYKIEKIKNKYIDTIEMSRAIYRNERKHNLDIICRRLNIEIKNRHRALGDAYATALAFIKMKQKVSYVSFIKNKEY